ncbi:PLD-like domain-containing protein [Clostridium cochlearium]|uniref:PLD-like domain-containing protein n=1 Tax=Clostridium cochlearium TaxID=1494 RepID=A0ABY0QJ80_CLOCO|nr:phospholipase D-like domain-containing protein [Clostridium cochlearium]SDK94973.1 PLD-like domain-containing protein [Clostridium cochlearium]
MNKDVDLISMFDESINISPDIESIKIMNLDYIDSDITNWEELFSGYSTLYAVTYSSSIDFISKLLPMFEEVEIIFGFEKVLKGLDDIMAYQQAALEELQSVFSKKEKKLLNRIDDGTLKLFLMRDRVSHKKMYLLKGEGLAPKVITGSANLSNLAFTGRQLENIYVLKGEKAYNEFLSEFNEMKSESTDSISKEAIILANDENIENIPVISSVKAQKVVVIEPEREIINNSNKTVLIRHEHIKKKYKDIVPKPAKTGSILLNYSEVKKITRKMNQIKIEKNAIERKTPKLKIDIDNNEVILDGKPLDLNPSLEEIENDVNLFIDYFEGFKIFLGDTEDAIKKYYAFTNWFFASPFMSVLRNYATIYNKPITPYPVFGLLYGKSNAGKTKLLETLMIMMVGQKVVLPAKEFTKSLIYNLREETLGFPIVIDDLNNARFRYHAIELIKDDSHIAENFSVIAISANEDVKAVENELSKRMIICHITASLPKMEAMRGSLVRTTQKNIGTNFYREYLKKMMDEIHILIEELSDDSKEAPDVFAVSSKIMKEIICKSYQGQVPDWVTDLKLDYYFETLAEQSVKQKIITMWNSNPKMFKADKKSNLLTIDTGDYHEANRIVGELPSYIHKGTANGVISLDLKYAEEYFEQNFNLRFIDRIIK